MEWYYAKEGKQQGPVNTDQLHKLLSNGDINRQTLVWREGMPNWQSYETTFASTPPPLLVGSGQRQLCSSCRRYCAEDELLKYGTLLICASCKPAFLQKLKESGQVTAGHLWRSRKTLVMDRDSILPDRCIKCNQPAHGYRLKRKLFWHNSFIYLLIFFNILIYAIVASLTGKKATIEVGLCETHQRKRKQGIIIGWCSVLLGFLIICIGATQTNPGLFIMIGILTAIVGGITGATLSSVVSAKKIDATHLHIKGASPDYLRDLPEWTGSN
jgi:hypothetical protein